MEISRKEIEAAQKAVKEAQALIITTGAGMGVDSGLPDFRGNSGFWREYPVIKDLGISFSQMANPDWFDEQPRLAWAFYGHRLNLYRETVPHKGFEMLKKLGEQTEHGYFVFSSNVDGQFQKAGFDSDRIEEVHGSIHHFQCSKPCSSKIWDASKETVSVDMSVFKARPPLPVCPDCGSIARPNVLMFGDWNWIAERSARQAARHNSFLSMLKKEKAKILIIEIGAGKAVPTVRMTSARIARATDAFLIRINPRDYELPRSVRGVSISAGAVEALEQIL